MKSSIRSGVLLCVILLSDLIGCNSVPNEIKIELPINDTVKTINIKIIENINIPSLTITCLNYNALNDLNGSILKQINWKMQQGKWIFFENCFNNETSNANYKTFNLEEFLNTGSSDLWKSIDVTFHKFAFVDENVFFNQFKFNQYSSISFYNIGFESTTFLSSLVSNTAIIFRKNNFIDFNYFESNSISKVQSMVNNILNFDASNLRKFTKLTDLQLYYSNFNNDVNVFNVPNLFEFNPALLNIYIEKSVTKLVLNESVFNTLNNLTRLSLASNQIEHISENLFHELSNLQRLELDNNMIKNLHENTFLQNTKLTYLSLDGNKLLTFSESTNNLNFGSPNLRVSLLAIEFSSVAQLKNILNNANINQLELTQFNVPELNIEDFSVIQNRTKQIEVTVQAGQTYFNVPILFAENLTKPNTEYSTFIQIDIRDGSRMCHECNFIKQVLALDADIVYAEDDNLSILLEFTLSLECRTYNMQEHFYRKFEENCPQPCECRYNELIDKVRVDCSFKKLTNIPTIMYPTQYNNIDSIDLIFSNNLLSTVDFANQHAMVMDKLSTINFENNIIETITMDGNPPKFIHYFNICDNPILESGTNSLEITTVDGVELIEKNNCEIGTRYLPNLKNIAQQKSEDRIKELLKTCV